MARLHCGDISSRVNSGFRETPNPYLQDHPPALRKKPKTGKKFGTKPYRGPTWGGRGRLGFSDSKVFSLWPMLQHQCRINRVDYVGRTVLKSGVNGHAPVYKETADARLAENNRASCHAKVFERRATLECARRVNATVLEKITCWVTGIYYAGSCRALRIRVRSQATKGFWIEASSSWASQRAANADASRYFIAECSFLVI